MENFIKRIIAFFMVCLLIIMAGILTILYIPVWILTGKDILNPICNGFVCYIINFLEK